MLINYPNAQALGVASSGSIAPGCSGVVTVAVGNRVAPRASCRCRSRWASPASKGLTAYAVLVEHARPRPGETFVVSLAGGCGGATGVTAGAPDAPARGRHRRISPLSWRLPAAGIGINLDGAFAYAEDVCEGLEEAPESLARVLTGGNFGKSLIHIAD